MNERTPSDAARAARAARQRPLFVLTMLGLLLTVTVVPAPFTIDENHYLTSVLDLREGRLTVAGTEGLSPSVELLWFDPEAPLRRAVATPVTTTVPPLYAFVALPFSYLGWRGLVALNTLAFLAAAAAVFALAGSRAANPATPWLAAAAFALGGYSIEYAQGLWPQMLAVALTTASFALAARLRTAGHADWPAATSGLVAGLAAGVRYQNILFAAAVGLGILLFAERRIRRSLLFAFGLLPAVAASSWMNHLRLGSWNPISKGQHYLPNLDAAAGSAGGGDAASFWSDFGRMAWCRLVDYSACPPLGGEHVSYLHRDPVVGTWLVDGAVKKAWLQSAPWLALAALAIAAAWLGRGGATTAEGARRRELRAMGLVILPVLAAFAAAGTGRTDGLGYNQRYFLELVPLAAVAFAWALERWRLPAQALVAGAVVAALLLRAALAEPFDLEVRIAALVYGPLLLATALAAVWILARCRPHGPRRALAALTGATLAWALVAHLGDDLAAARGRRARNEVKMRLLDRALPVAGPLALVTLWSSKNAAGALRLDRDLVILETRLDGGADTPKLVGELLARGRRVFLLANDFGAPELSRLAGGRPFVLRASADLVIAEVVAPPAGEAPTQKK